MNDWPQIGVFAHETPATSVGHLVDLLAERGIPMVQLHGTVRDQALEDPARVRAVLDAAGIGCVGVGAYGNIVAPDPERRRRNLDLVARSLRAAPELGVPAVSTETGTLHPTGEWDDDPRNTTPEAWEALLRALDELLPVAEASGAVLALEGYVKNVLRTLDGYAALVERYPTPALGFVADPYNLLAAPLLPRQTEVTAEMFERFGDRFAIAHLKDVAPGGAEVGTPAFGEGVFDQTAYLRLLRDRRPDLALVIEHLEFAQAEAIVDRVRRAVEDGGMKGV